MKLRGKKTKRRNLEKCGDGDDSSRCRHPRPRLNVASLRRKSRRSPGRHSRRDGAAACPPAEEAPPADPSSCFFLSSSPPSELKYNIEERVDLNLSASDGVDMAGACLSPTLYWSSPLCEYTRAGKGASSFHVLLLCLRCVCMIAPRRSWGKSLFFIIIFFRDEKARRKGFSESPRKYHREHANFCQTDKKYKISSGNAIRSWVSSRV